LKTIAKRSGDVYIPRGVSVPALDKDTLWEFQPTKIGTREIKLIFFLLLISILNRSITWTVFFSDILLSSLMTGEGDLLTGGDLYAVCFCCL